MASKWRVSGAIHLQQAPAGELGDNALTAAKQPLTAIRIEGFARQVAVAAAGLRTLLSCYGDVIDLDEEGGASLWRDIHQLRFISRSSRPLWRISTAPRNGPVLVSELSHIFEVRASYDWAGGLIWLETPPSSDVSASDIRRSVAHLGGHATLIRADNEVRTRIEVFHPAPGALGRLTNEIKNSFDPKRILNPGRIYAESGNL
jgi:glycolate oxidase FAD binding subunit